MKVFTALFLCLTAIASASTKEAPAYQDATLKDFQTSQQGQTCRSAGGSTGSVIARTSDSGNTTGTIDTASSGATRCSPNMVAFYTVVVGEHEYVLTPRRLPFPDSPVASIFRKNSDLSGVLPGTPIKVRTDSDNFYVKVGNRESAYKIVSAK